MSLLAIILVSVSALLHALKSFFTKTSLNKKVFLWWYTALGVVLYLPVFLYFLSQNPLPLRAALLWGSCTGLIHLAYNLCYTKAYELGDLSLVYPIMRSSPALTLILAVTLLGEEVSVQGVLGILAVVFGIYCINLKKLNLVHLLKPLKALVTDRAQQFALLTMFTVVAYSIVDKLGAESMHPLLFSYLISFSTVCLYSVYLLPQVSAQELRAEWEQSKKTILTNALISPGGYYLIVISFSFEKVSYVTGLRQLSVVFAVVLGSHLLKEEGKFVRLFSALVIFLGSFLIALG